MNRNRDRESVGTGLAHSDTAPAGPDPLTPERAPSIQSRLVRREALFERLSAAPANCVVLVCAPAGSGKTMLLRSWLDAAGLSEQTAWAAVEQGERDAQHFWLSVIDALAGTAAGSVERIGPTPGFRGEAVVERLLEDLRSVEEPLVLVIDDLHELQSPEALRWLELLVARRPANLSLMLTSRAEPQLNLHRLRLAAELTEIRASDLRFSPQEAGGLLRASEIELSDEAVALLHERTEGWVAGLRLAAISLAGHPHPERFVRDFSGSERSVAGYLMAEVLERQPPEVRELLLRTAILDRVTGRLADAMTGRSDSERILLDLEEANAFVTSLDVDRTWFRYHHLFADFLRLELRRTDPASIDALHGVAARWYEEHGHPAEAIRHAQATSDWTYATRLLADSYISLILDGRLETVAGLLATFPPEAAAEDAELAIVLAGARLFEGRADDTDAYIEVAERLAETVPQDRRRRFDLRVASTKLWLARRSVDLASALEAKREVEAALAAQSASDIARVADHRAAAVMNVGITELWSLRTDEARRHLEEALSLAQQAERPYLEISCLAHLGIAGPDAGGSILDGVHYAEQAIARAEALGWGEEAIITPALAISGVALMWLGRFDEAERRLDRADRGAAARGGPDDHAHRPLGDGAAAADPGSARGGAGGTCRGAAAQLADGQGGADDRAAGCDAPDPGAHGQGRRSERRPRRARRRRARPRSHPDRHCRDPPGAGRSRSGARSAGARDRRVPAGGSLDDVADRRAAVRRAGPGTGSATRAQPRRRSSGRSSSQSPRGSSSPLRSRRSRELLERHPRHRTAHGALLSEILDVLSGASPNGRRRAAASEDLSEAELRVVRFLPSNLKAPEIAAELFVSPNTVRTHLRHIYAKLDAHSRAEAVERARELGLLAPSRLG